jgi:probable HAF family extracellular repeat protein
MISVKGVARVVVLAVVVVLGLCSSAALAEVQYTLTPLGTLGGSWSWAFAINDSGQIVGYAMTSGDQYGHAFLYDGTMHDLGTFGGTSSAARGINASGQVVGNAMTSGDAAMHAFLYDGTMHDLGILGAVNPFPGLSNRSYALAINDCGQVVGSSTTSYDQGIGHAFLYDGTMHDLTALSIFARTVSSASAINNSGQIVGYARRNYFERYAFLYDGTMHDLGTLGGTIASASGINANGQVVGFSTTNDGWEHAFLYDGTMHDLGTFGGTYSSASGINASGQVVGYAMTSGNQYQRAFLYDGTMHDLNSLIDPASGWTLTDATAINARGQIVGVGLNPAGESRAFFITPVASKVILTHGWMPAWNPGSGNTEKFTSMESQISSRLSEKQQVEWDVEFYDWSKQATTFEAVPIRAAKNAKSEGENLGKTIIYAGYENVHLVSHSAGA